ncbi:MAG: DEAD/DEAH box helicase family protein [Hungatella sp.]
MARSIEQDNYPESKNDLPVEKLIEFPWFQRLAVQYQDLLEQAGEEPAVEIPYLSSEAAIEKENTDGEKEEVPDNEKSDILETVFYDVTKAFSLHSMTLIPSKPLIQNFFKQAGDKDKQEFLLRLLELQSKRDYGKSVLNTDQGLVHYTIEKGTVDFQLMHGEKEGHGRFTMQEAARVIQEAIDAGEYLSPGEYEAAVKEGFSLCPEESYQLYKEMQNRNQSVSQASDFFYPDAWEIPSGDKTKYKSNVAAIQLLKELEQSSRPATPEEQIILARYVGWGGLANAFNPKSPNWTNEYQELQELLTEEEYEQARASVNSAFYTPPVVAKVIYKALQQFGFEGGSILEPSMGIGNFYSVLPEDMRNSQLYGVELDSISGRIAKQLHPHATIQVKGFEKTKFEKNKFDVVVGNVPFGAYKVFDPEYKKYGFRIHDYFLAKSIDLVRPGGMIAVVTTKFTMDKANSIIRKYIAERADFVGAVRLPGIAFKKDAGAEVTSDIIFLQKKGRLLTANTSEDWMNITYTDDGVPVNEYFSRHPEMMLGKMAFDTHTYGPNSNYTELIVEDEEHFDFEEQLNRAISFLSATYLPEEKKTEGVENNKEELPDTIPALLEVANNTYTVIEGEIYYRDNDSMVRWKGNETKRKRILGMHAIRQSVRYLIDIQTRGCTEEQLTEGQAQLNKIYDAYVKEYGYLSSRGNKLAFREDNDYYLLCSLETEDENKNVKKSDIFYKQTIAPQTYIEKADTAMDALQISLAEYGKVHIPYMQSLYPVDREQLLAELKGQIFLNPVKADETNPNQGWETASEYLSGPVRKKLKTAEMYAQRESQYSANVEALKAVQPEDLSAADISVKLGTAWVELEDYEAFIYELLNTPESYRTGPYAIKVQLNRYTMSYKVTNKSADYSSVVAKQTYGTKRIDAYSIIEALLNQNIITVKDAIESGDSVKYVVNQKETTLAREKATMIKEAFKEWIWKDPDRRKKYVDFYNQNFNDNRLRVYDGSYLTFPGMNPEKKMRPHQRNVIERAIHGSTLLAHAVGAGKTYEMAAICMELKRLKLMNKAMIVVPNHLVGQMASEFLTLYPGANLLVTRKEDFTKENRRKLTCKIAANNYDAVILGHSQFERIPLSADRRAAMLEEQVDRISNAVSELKEEQGAKWGIKDMERQRANLEAQILELRNDAKKDDVLDFEQLGIDALFVDEAHVFKNLSIFTKIRNVAGIATNGSQRAMDMFQKIQYIQEHTGGRNVFLATGTPISNTMCEMYVMQLYLQSQKLREKGIEHFDSWAANFGEVTTSLEMSPEGGYRMRSRFNKFCNLPELMNMFREVADIQLPSMLDLNVPKLKGGKYKIVESVASDSVDIMMQELVRRAEQIRNGSVDPSEDNMLKITNEARLLGTDPRLIDPDAEVDEDGKLYQAAENIYQEYVASQDFKGTQVVFSDIGTPTGKKGFNVYDFLKGELIKKGIPRDEIAFIHDAKNDKQKEELFADMRSGRKRILIGSTSMMGTGTNIQKRLCAAHHIDCPWKPSDIERAPVKAS